MTFFDAYTLNNLDRLIAYSSLITGITFGAMAAIETVGSPSDRVIGRWLWGILFAVIIALVVIYSLFLSRLPNIDYFVPRSLPEVLFMVITFELGILLSIVVSKVYLAYLPSETAPLMRIRAILIIASAFTVSGYFIVKIMIAFGYFWPVLASEGLMDLSWIFFYFHNPFVLLLPARQQNVCTSCVDFEKYPALEDVPGFTICTRRIAAAVPGSCSPGNRTFVLGISVKS